MGIGAQLPTILTVVLTAAIDSINPCAIGVLILMMSVVLAGGQSVRRLLFLGSVYVFAVFAVYLLAGLGLLYFLASIPLFVTEYLSIAVGTLVIAAGLLEVKDYFWYGRWFSLTIPPVFAKMLHGYASRTTVWGVALLGGFVSAVELPCTGAPYLAIITVLSQNFNSWAFALLVLYNIIFVAPLIVMLAMVAAGAQLQQLKAWKQEARGGMRLAIGLLLIGLGWLLMLIANGTINFG
jgi:cytochrome c biogenesis protein CcdA